jgi:hypothetical protein
MRLRFRVLGTVVSLAAVLAAGGFHWLVLQSVAWGSMLVRFAQEDPFAVAVEKTLDGQHPCPLCLKVREGRQEEREKPPLLQPEKLTDLFCETRRVTAPAPPSAPQPTPPLRLRAYSDFVTVPPKPPPRLV